MRVVVAGILSAFILGGTASAATMGPLSCTGVPPVGLAPTELSGAISCPLFSAAGILTSMSLTFSGDIAGTVTLTNGTTTPQSGSAQTQVQFYFGPLSGFSLGTPLFTVVGSTGPITVPASGTQGFPVAGSQSATLTNNSTLAPYVGVGSFNIPISTQTFLLLNFGGGNVTAQQATAASANATVTYEFSDLTTVPEPTTLALLGSGLLALAARRRRSRK